MNRIGTRASAAYERLDEAITSRLARWGVPAARVALGVVFLWFGFLKFVPG